VVNVRQHPDARFNVLLTQDRPYVSGVSGHWTQQFPRLLEPQGVVSYTAHSGREAMAITGRVEIHAAVLDLATPLEESDEFGESEAGFWLIELFRRLPGRPPIIIVHNAAYSQKMLGRLMHEALRLGAFSVLNKPVELERLLAVFQRLVDRQYRGAWPGSSPTPPEASQPTLGPELD
jgi:CheY-like chemotaxis protein